MIAEAINQTVGSGVGIFIGCLIGFSIRARQGKTGGMINGSIWQTALVAGMLAWIVSAVLYVLF